MAPKYDEAPEVAPDAFPEVHDPPCVPEVNTFNSQSAYIPGKWDSTINLTHITPVASTPYDNAAAGTYGYFPSGYTGNAAAQQQYPQEKAPKRIWGCSVLVFVLSAIIALLSAAVVGLASGVGVAMSRAHDAQGQLDALAASAAPASTVTMTAAAPSATPTDTSSLDKGCSTDPNKVSGTNYTAAFFDRPTYQIYCNSDTPIAPLYSLFVANFDDCMDACAHWRHYAPQDFGDGSARNQTCAGLSFIPLWTNRTDAVNGNAPGNCYLKPGPQNRTALTDPNIGTPVHAALLVSDE